MKKIIWSISTIICWSMSITATTAYAASREFNVAEGIPMAILFGILTPMVGMAILVGMSRKKKKARTAVDYIKDTQGGTATITGQKDDYVRTITERRESGSRSSGISGIITDAVVDAGSKAIKNSINKNK